MEGIKVEIYKNNDGIPVGKIIFSDGRELVYEGIGDSWGTAFFCNDNDLRDEMEDSSDEYEKLRSAMFGYMIKMNLS